MLPFSCWAEKNESLLSLLVGASFTYRYIIADQLVGILQIVLWIAMAVVAYRFDSESSVVKKNGWAVVSFVVAIAIGTLFLIFHRVWADRASKYEIDP